MPCDHRTLPSVHVPRSDSAWACFSLMDPCGRVRKGSARAGLDQANLGGGVAARSLGLTKVIWMLSVGLGCESAVGACQGWRWARILTASRARKLPWTQLLARKQFEQLDEFV